MPGGKQLWSICQSCSNSSSDAARVAIRRFYCRLSAQRFRVRSTPGLPVRFRQVLPQLRRRRTLDALRFLVPKGILEDLDRLVVLAALQIDIAERVHHPEISRQRLVRELRQLQRTV